ncbi:DUF2062 domain-containing protein [Hymenobacter sp. BT683]|uniref:DUF2062 domain-containing protein n=1 Tax=Hymenobacter jeongseonensis TaxID=2791027 RepID=A0ABS0ILY2_9BACT|nr:DUF2062 domain-containing protein [Hymenobacter jeongseonensis]MBF9239384.1 DUF2062 domain-containing protein [Hymenobacter jeongseonensis]
MPTSPVPPVTEITPATVAPPAGWLRRRLLNPMLGLLRQGLSPEQLALTVALGVSIGSIPLMGAITTVAALVAVRLRLNVAALQFTSHMMTPLQLIIIIPLLRQGARLMGNTQENELTLANVRHLFATDWRAALQLLWRAEVGAMLIWLLSSIPVVAVLYFLLRPVFRRIAQRRAAAQEAA